MPYIMFEEGWWNVYVLDTLVEGFEDLDDAGQYLMYTTRKFEEGVIING